MKGNPVISERLNTLLRDEPAVITQYHVFPEMCDNPEYRKQGKQIEGGETGKMKHTGKQIGRIFFPVDTQEVIGVNRIAIVSNIEKPFMNEQHAGTGALKIYNNSKRLCTELGDTGTRQFTGSILQDEQEHPDSPETQIEQIKQLQLADDPVEQTS